MNLWQDIRFAVRLLVKDRWFTPWRRSALALGIGVNATVFTFVNAVLIRGLPFNDPDRIMVGRHARRPQPRPRRVVSGLRGLAPATRAFTGLAAYSGQTMNVSDEGRAPERFQGPYMSANAFKLIGAAAAGRPRFPAGRRPSWRACRGDPRQRRVEESIRQRSRRHRPHGQSQRGAGDGRSA